MRTRWRKTWLAAIIVSGTAAAVSILPGAGGSYKKPDSLRSTAALPVYHMDADSANYTTVGEITSGSDVVAVGRVESQSTEPGASPGVDAEGEPLPAIPHTNSVVVVGNVFKGAVSPGASIVVVLAGGTTERGTFVLDGGPELNDGETRLFFLHAGTDGNFYPLAGGAAVGAQQPDGSFALPSQATGAEALVVTEAALRGSAGQQNASGLRSGGANIPANGGVLAAKTANLKATVHLLPHQRLAIVLAHGLRLRTTCSQPCAIGGQLAVGARVAKALKLAHARRGAVVAAGRSPSSGGLILYFTKDARRRLREHSGARLTLTMRARGVRGERVTVVGTVILAVKSARLSR